MLSVRLTLAGVILPLVLAMPPVCARAADLAGWDRTRWGMTSSEVVALYGDRAMRLAQPIEFAGLYTDVVLRRVPFAGLEFTVYFQMSTETHRLAQVLLERQRQLATASAWHATVAALTQAFGTPTASCNQEGQPLEGEPLLAKRVWVLPTTTVRASFLDFGPYVPVAIWRRLLVRYAPTRPGQADCQG